MKQLISQWQLSVVTPVHTSHLAFAVLSRISWLHSPLPRYMLGKRSSRKKKYNIIRCTRTSRQVWEFPNQQQTPTGSSPVSLVSSEGGNTVSSAMIDVLITRARSRQPPLSGAEGEEDGCKASFWVDASATTGGTMRQPWVLDVMAEITSSRTVSSTTVTTRKGLPALPSSFFSAGTRTREMLEGPEVTTL